MTPLLLLALLVPLQESREVRKARSYLNEVKRHLLESYIDRDRLDDAALVAAALRGLDKGLEHKDLGVTADVRDAARRALRSEETLGGALQAVAAAAPGLDLLRWADHGAHAMIRETGDPFSRVLTADDMKDLLKMMGGGGKEEQTAGCALHPDGQAWKVVYVQYGTPAYEAGLEIGDEVTSVRGRTPADLPPDELSKTLVLRGGETLDVSVRRNGKTYPFKLRPSADARTVHVEHLGQGIGYVRLTIFDMSADRSVRDALRQLQRRGLKGLILDLRHNPGGALPAAIAIADLFLPQDLPVARTVSHYKPTILGFKFPGLELPAEFKTKSRSEFEDLPVVCLINGASASASELLAGALQDHGRAVLVGAKTYGKGVGQTPILLNSMFLQRYLYLTVMRYTTPRGNDVDHVGVSPDVPFAAPRPSPETFDALWALRTGGALEKYLDAQWGEEVKSAADYDGFDTGRWPGFDAFHRGLGTTLPADAVRDELRVAARRRLAREGRAFAADLQSDVVLQRGLVTLLDRLK